ncbi:MAG: M48 family metalloprotease, partial [Bacteroidota bacterium]
FGTAISIASFYLTFLLFKAGLSFFAFNEIHDIVAFPLLALILMIMGLLFMPIQNTYLRHLEKQADMFAIEHIQSRHSFISAITKLGNQNLSDPSPSRWEELLLYSHPPISKRLRYAGPAPHGGARASAGRNQ